MPCNSDYMEPNSFEKSLSDVLYFIEEVKNGKKVDSSKIGKGYNVKVYSKGLPKEVLDLKVEKLCSLLQSKSKEEIKKYSLELQIWWRNHKAEDKKRVKAEMDKPMTKSEKKKAFSKLTLYERKLLTNKKQRNNGKL